MAACSASLKLAPDPSLLASVALPRDDQPDLSLVVGNREAAINVKVGRSNTKLVISCCGCDCKLKLHFQLQLLNNSL